MASAAARALERSLTERGHAVTTFRATVPRTVADMNRPESRGTPWRDEIDKTAPDIFLDVHSFPGNGLDVYLLSLLDPLPWHVAMARALAAVSRAGIRQGSLVNDIMKRASERRIPSVLIEFSEGLDELKLKEICDAIAKFVSHMEKM